MPPGIKHLHAVSGRICDKIRSYLEQYSHFYSPFQFWNKLHMKYLPYRLHYVYQCYIMGLNRCSELPCVLHKLKIERWLYEEKNPAGICSSNANMQCIVSAKRPGSNLHH